MVTEHPLNNTQEREVKAMLAESLADKHPRCSARSILRTQGTKRGRGTRRAIAAIAACLVAVLMLSSFKVPVLARALSSVPLIGEAYLNFIRDSGLDIAYQAGFVSAPGQIQERYGITLTVLGAYADSIGTAVMFTLTSEEAGLLEQLWEGSYAPWLGEGEQLDRLDLRPWVRTRGSGGGGSTMRLDEEANIIYGVVEVYNSRNPFTSAFGRTVTLEITSGRGRGEPVWELSFPVQSVPGKHVQKVRIDHTFTSNNLRITLEEIIFSPAQTVVLYSTTTGSLGTSEGSSSRVIGGGTLPPEQSLDHWSIKLPDGSELLWLGASYSSSGSTRKGQGTVRFAPTEERNVSIYFGGQSSFLHTELALLLEVGASDSTSHGDLAIESLSFGEEAAEILLSWSGESMVQKIDASLLNTATKELVQLDNMTFPDENLLNLVFPAVESDPDWTLLIDAIHIKQLANSKVYEVVPNP